MIKNNEARIQCKVFFLISIRRSYFLIFFYLQSDTERALRFLSSGFLKNKFQYFFLIIDVVIALFIKKITLLTNYQ